MAAWDLQDLGSGLSALGQGFQNRAISFDPQLARQDQAQQFQARQRIAALNADQRNYLAQHIMQGVQSGDIPWENGQRGLSRLGFPVEGLSPDLFGNMGQQQQLQSLYGQLGNRLGGGQQGLQQSPFAPPAAQVPPVQFAPPPQTATPGVGQPAQTAPLQQQTPMQQTELPSENYLMSEKKDDQGRVTQRTYRTTDGGESTETIDPATGKATGATSTTPEVTIGTSPEEQQQLTQSRRILARPPLQMGEIVDMVNKSGLRGAARRDVLEKQAPIWMKEDQERRALALDNQKAVYDNAQRRLNKPGEVRHLHIGESADGRERLQDQRFNPQTGAWEDEGKPYTEKPPISVTQKMSPGDTEAQKLSAKELVDKIRPALIANNVERSQIKLAKELLTSGTYSGSAAGAREGLGTFLSTVFPRQFTPEMRAEVARTGLLGKVNANFLLDMVSKHIFQQRTTNMDVQFLNRVVPQLDQTPDAQIAILNMMDYYNDWEKKVLKDEQAYYKKHGEIASYEPPEMNEQDSYVRKGLVPKSLKELVEQNVPATPREIDYKDVTK